MQLIRMEGSTRQILVNSLEDNATNDLHKRNVVKYIWLNLILNSVLINFQKPWGLHVYVINKSNKNVRHFDSKSDFTHFAGRFIPQRTVTRKPGFQLPRTILSQLKYTV